MASPRKPYHERSNRSRFLKRIKRQIRKLKRRSGWFRYYFAVIHKANSKGQKLKKSELPVLEKYIYRRSPQPSRPKFSDNIIFLAQNKDAFSKKSIDVPKDGTFKIPNPFSLTENYDESFLFLKQLFYCLYTDKIENIVLDYGNCERIDVDASVCMDVMLHEFIVYYESCRRRGLKNKLKSIVPIKFDKEPVKKILFSIGAFKNIKGIEIKYPDIIPFNLLIGDNFSAQKGRDKELEVTKLVDYIIKCLDRMNHNLTWEAENDLSKVVGEVIVNAAEHSGRKYRYAIGYFQESKNEGQHLGVFNLTIFDFGNTIYQTFKKPEVAEREVTKRMQELSQKYTKKKLFKDKEFEEETLWTLYSLQEGVTSVLNAKRGNGSIHFIESFFRLKGDMAHDNSSFLTIMSGNTRITFDGKYQICEKQRGKEGHIYKMMTFNDSGDIEEQPDKKYVTFAENFFPGTMIVAKICINFKNLQVENAE